MKIKDRNREKYLRTFQPGERDVIKQRLEEAFQRNKKRKRGDL